MRFIALVLAALLATTPACAHRQQLTNEEVATGVLVLMIAGALFVASSTADCQRNPDCLRHDPAP